ncbi:MAG: hypothetical protein ABIO43_05380 [Sphingomicrobium sp.]
MRARGSPCGAATHANRTAREAERMRRHNEEMKLALAEDLPLSEARRRLAFQHYREWEQRKALRERCGTADVAAVAETIAQSPPPQESPRYWWLDERL